MLHRRHPFTQALCKLIAWVYLLQITNPVVICGALANIGTSLLKFGVQDAQALTLDELKTQIAPPLMVAATVTPFTVGLVQDNRVTITYTVFNSDKRPVSDVLLATTLSSGVNFESATPSADRQGRELRWSLGSLAPHGSASVQLRVVLDTVDSLPLDAGARAFGNIDALETRAVARAAALRDIVIDPALVSPTPDANSTDPFIVAQAALLGNDPLELFHFVRDKIGFESYDGSLRGARGTLWAGAGNSLDKASLLVALLRASGIPARYAHGALDTPTAQLLILSMFPPYFRITGFVTPSSELADPANDPKLLAETTNHYWVEYDPDGSGFQALDPTVPGSAVNQTFASPDEAFNEVPDAVRHKVSFRIKAETTTASLFGGSFQGLQTVLEQTFPAVALVGKPVHFGQFVSSSGTAAPVFSVKSFTYSPYLIVNQGDNDLSDDELIRGTDFQEVLTNFPFGSQIFTGLFLEMDTVAPDGTVGTYTRTIKDRIGYDVRQTGGTPSIGNTDLPALSPFDVVTVNVSTGRQPENIYTRRYATFQNASAALSVLKPQVDAINALNLPTLTPEQSALVQSASALETTTFQLTSALITERFLQYSDIAARTTEVGFASRIYADSPRLTVASHLTAIDVQGGNVEIKTKTQIDLRKDNMRAVLRPGQARSALPLLNQSLGFAENGAETYAVKLSPDTVAYSAFEALRVARENNIPTIILTSANAQALDDLSLSLQAKTRISEAIHSGKFVHVPQEMVQLGETTTVGWYETDVDTGETIGVMEDGTHGGITEYAEVQALFAYIENHFLEIIAKVQGALIGFGLTLTIAGLEIMALRASGADKQDIQDFIDGLAAAAGFGFGGMGVGGFVAGQIVGQYFQTIAEFIALLQNSGLPLIAFGYISGIMTGVGAAASVLKAATIGDPPVLPLLGVGGGIGAPSSTEKTVPIAQSLSAGAATGTQVNKFNRISGELQVSFTSTDGVSLQLNSFSAPNATVRDEFGDLVGSGDVNLANGSLVDASFDGVEPVSITGTGTLSFYGAVESPLGVSGDWSSFSGSFGPGAGSLTVTANRLALDGSPLPSGKYLIELGSLTFTGAGASAASNFNTTVSIDALNSSVEVGAGSGAAAVNGNDLDVDQGYTLTHFNGNVSISDAGSASDTVSFSGTADDVLLVDPVPPLLFADQNTEVTTQLNVLTSHDGSYLLQARAPPGWRVTIDDTNQLVIKPAAGLQSGSYLVQVSARSIDLPELVASATVQVDIGGTAPGLSLDIIPDNVYTVSYAQTDLPTAFRAEFRNLGPAEDFYTVAVTQLPDSFTIDQSASQLTVPAGELAEVGFYLRPNSVGGLPPPGTPITFEVQVTSVSDPGISQTASETFIMPEVHAVRISTDPVSLTVPPGGYPGESGGQSSSRLVVENVGNVLESNIVVTTEVSAGLDISGIGYDSPLNLSLPPGTSHEAFLNLIPAADAELGSLLGANFNATYGAAGSEKISQAFALVTVSVQAVSDVNQAALAAANLGQSQLANTLIFLGGALLDLFGDPSNELFQSQTIAGINSLLSQITDPLFVNQSNSLSNLLSVIAGGVAGEIQGAINGFSGVFGGISDTLAALKKHDFTITLLPNSQEADGTNPSLFQILIVNQGTAPTTFSFSSVLGNPGNVEENFSYSEITINPGEQSPPDLTLSLTQTGTVVAPFGFSFYAFVLDSDGGGLSKSVSGSLTLRAESVQVPKVTPLGAPFVDPGATVPGVLATVLSVVNTARQLRLNYEVKNPLGEVVVTSSSPTEISAQIDPTSQIPTLPGFSTVGLPDGDYTIEVTVTETDGTPIPGAFGVGQLFIGFPVQASLTVVPDRILPGSSGVTTQLNLQRNGHLNPPLPLLGSTTTGGNPIGLALKGNYAFVANGTTINRVNVSNPAAPVVDGNIGSGLTAQTLAIQGNTLYWHGTSSDQKHTRLGAIDITDPTAPVTLGEITLEPWFAGGIDAVGSTVYAAFQNFVYFVLNSDISSVSGNFVAVDFSNPLTPVEKSRPYDETVDGASLGPIPHSSPHFLFEKVPVGADHVYMATSSATGGDTLNGVGQIKVIDTSNANSVQEVKVLDIPGTVNAISIKPQGTHALVVGTSEGINDPGFPAFSLRGHIVLTNLDVSDPADPTIVSQLDIPTLTANFGTTVEPLGNDRYLIGQRVKPTNTNDNVIMIVDASDPENLTFFTKRLLQGLETYNFKIQDNKLYAVATTGFFIFDLANVAPTTYRVEVQIPRNSGVNYVPFTFNIEPSQIIPGPDSDTVIWEDEVIQPHIAFDAGNLVFSWTTQILEMGPVETRAVTGDSKVQFSLLGFPGEVDLLPAFVSSEIVVGLSPSTVTVIPGQEASFNINVRNPASALATAFILSVIGVPDSWVNINNGNSFVVVQGFGNTNVPLKITPDTDANQQEYRFVVLATPFGQSQQFAGSARGSVLVQGEAVLPPVGPPDGVVVQLLTPAAVAGRDNPAKMRLRVTNTGTATKSFSLSAATPNFDATFSEPQLTLLPGISNFHEVDVELFPKVFAAPGDHQITFKASMVGNPSVNDMTEGTVTLFDLGVRVFFDVDEVLPNSTVTMTVANFGGVLDTYNLALSGPVGVFSDFDNTPVTLDVGESINIPVHIGAIPIATAGLLPLIGSAQSTINSAIQSSDSLNVRIEESSGFDVIFDPDLRTITAPGDAGFLLLLKNFGNTEGDYEASIIDTTNGVVASLQRASGAAGDAVPLFRVPGLGAASLFLNARLLQPGSATVTVRVSSPSTEEFHDAVATIVFDGEDQCPEDPSKVVPGICGCGVSDADSDGDGTANCLDSCSADPLKTTPGVCGCGTADLDSDGDGLFNCQESCPNDPLKTSPGTCGCGTPDIDDDGDGVFNCQDSCAADPNKTAPGICGCGVSDADSDNDGVANCNDSCVSDPNKSQPGICGCGVSDADADGDGTANCLDSCQLDPLKLLPGVCGCGVSDADSDGDGTPNCNDQCANDPAKSIPGICGCGVSDIDGDGDGTADCSDSCSADPHKIVPGVCGCGVPDADGDSDGVLDCVDQCPTDSSKIVPGVCGCGVSDADSDEDGTPNCNDQCPTDPLKIVPGECGCGEIEQPNCTADLCPEDPNKAVPGICGCGVPDIDTDLDGAYDCNDSCPADPLKTAVGVCGCGVSDADDDGDGTPNCSDQCPLDPAKIVPGECGCSSVESPGCGDLCPSDPAKTVPGICGCGVADTDSDSDAVPNCNDSCPNDPGKIVAGLCGCGVADTDSDSDLTPDCLDQCPADSTKTAPLVCGCGVSEADTDHDGTPDCIDTPNPVDVSSLVTVKFVSGKTTLNRVTRQTTSVVTVSIRNSSTQIISGPFIATIPLSAGGVTIPEASGGAAIPPYNAYYVDLSGLLTGGTLDPGETISFTVSFIRNSQLNFTYSIVPIAIPLESSST